jgi:Ser/Thr protein kinase RdoA (MazF antagonist)
MVVDAFAIDVVLRSYRRVLPAVREHRPVDRPGFSGAIVRCVETADGPFCLRGWPQATIDGDRILGLHELLRHVALRGIDYVAVPLPQDEGTTVVRAAGRFWQLEPWLPGCADFCSSPSRARLTAAFVALGRFHQAARSFQPRHGGVLLLGTAAPTIAPTVVDRIELFERWTPERLAVIRAQLQRQESEFTILARRVAAAFQRSARRVADELRAVGGKPMPSQPCLRDVWHDHVLFQGDKVTGLIDPSAARTDTVAADIARLAGSLIADDRAAWDIALEAYRSVAPLSEREAQLVPVLDRSGILLSGMAWLERTDLWHIDQSAFAARVLDRLERIAQRAEQLARSIT